MINKPKKIVRLIGRDIDDITDTNNKALEMLLFKRAKIIYGASNKLKRLSTLIDEIDDKKKITNILWSDDIH